MGAIDLDGAYNVRDLGGLPAVGGGRTRYGLLYRGDSLDAISQRDEDLLFGKLRIDTVIDVRSPSEVAPADWRDHLGIHHFNIPLISDTKIGTEPFPAGAPEELAKVYLSNLRNGSAAVRETFEVLAAQLSADRPCIIHCAAGRDRTGIIVAVLLAVIGVAEQAIAQDYVRSNRHAQQVTRRLAENPLYANGPVQPDEPVMAVPETIITLLALLADAYGSAQGYLRQVGLSQEAIAQLRSALIEYR